MAALSMVLPPRTPSPKVRIHRSQSFDSPSSRISVTPIDDSPYSKSTSAIITKPLPRYDAMEAAEQGVMRYNKLALHTKISKDSIMSDASSNYSSVESSPVSASSDRSHYGLFSSGSPSLPPASPEYASADNNAPQIFSSSLQIYQDINTPMYDPWLVHIVLDMYDTRGFDWMTIAEPIERIWGFRTSSGEVLDILSGNGRVLGRRWWD
ncbi:hypothetical protein BDV95DRAFT_488065 [Massariosphaeria phaeospora]|uniref:Uncharacterized protein n=1 Tax=Massariosphaeria phaeospora TaxID=100035 RepID=A0A7C8MI82_9PLEO|nr:hypothetical protein BDV95DRAFT_488065 [Massariosphaeria phaeospora]